jgi:hypothetical protein
MAPEIKPKTAAPTSRPVVMSRERSSEVKFELLGCLPFVYS